MASDAVPQSLSTHYYYGPPESKPHSVEASRRWSVRITMSIDPLVIESPVLY